MNSTSSDPRTGQATPPLLDLARGVDPQRISGNHSLIVE